jgi:hypothetical protein
MRRLIFLLYVALIVYLSFVFGEEDYNSPENCDKMVTVQTVQYVPNGKSIGLSACTCIDDKGRIYNVTKDQIMYRGDRFLLTEHRSYWMSILRAFFVFAVLSLIAFVILGIFGFFG